MDVFLDILKNYWQLILAGVLFVVSVIVSIIRKRPIQDILSMIYGFAVLGVKEAEQLTSIDGETKLNRAVNYVINMLHLVYPKVDFDAYRSTIVQIIEDILSTPHKKG